MNASYDEVGNSSSLVRKKVKFVKKGEEKSIKSIVKEHNLGFLIP